MAHYIDADKLISEIERKRDSALERQKNLEKIGQETVLNEMIAAELNRLISFVTSLQQEQPDCHTVEEWIQHIKNSDQLTKDIFSKGPYDVLYDALNHPYQHCYDAIKEFGELCFQTGVNSVKQEQPEADLEKEVEKYLLDNADFVTKSTSNEMVNTLARHFYELGRNQVLQELYKGKIKPFDKIAATWLDDEQNT